MVLSFNGVEILILSNITKLCGGQLFEGTDVQMNRRSGGHTIGWTDICRDTQLEVAPFS